MANEQAAACALCLAVDEASSMLHIVTSHENRARSINCYLCAGCAWVVKTAAEAVELEKPVGVTVDAENAARAPGDAAPAPGADAKGDLVVSGHRTRGNRAGSHRPEPETPTSGTKS